MLYALNQRDKFLLAIVSWRGTTEAFYIREPLQ